ncbi:MAG TPA: alpha-galactosidase, partial [Terracidiphilus sp.]
MRIPAFFKIARVVIVLVLATASLWAQSVPNQKHWTLNNGAVSRTIAFDARDGLITNSWKNLKDGKEFIDDRQETMDGYCRGFRFSLDHRAYTGSSSQFRLAGAEESTDATGARHLELRLASRDRSVTVVAHYILPAGSTGVRQFLSIRNNTAQSLMLNHLSIACEPIAPAQPDNLLAYGGYGEQPREIFFTGRSDDVAILLENASTGDGVAVLSEVPGVLRRTEVGVIGKWHQWEPGVNVMYDTDLFPFERSIAPGETYATGAVSFVLYQRGTAQDPHWIIPQYVLANIARPQPQPRWMYNDWEPFETKIGAAQLMDVERAVAQSGFGIFVIDDGWERMRGDNTVDSTRFPEGLTPVEKLARQIGMEFGLWSPVAVADPDAPVVTKHPEWVCHDQNGRIRHMAGMVQMNLASPFRDDELQRLSALIHQYDLRYVKFDLTTVFNTYGEQPGCYGPGGEHTATPEVHEFVPRGYEALSYIANELHHRFPGLLIDYSFELWGGKHLIDYGLLRDADVDWMSNVADRVSTDAGPRAARMLLYQRGMAIPAETMLIGNLQGDTGSWRVRAATEMGSFPLLLGDFRRITPQDLAHYASWIARYQSLRKQIPLNQSFFPLGDWRQPRSNRWDGFARFSRQGEGLIVLFRNYAQNATAHLTIPGFPNGAFQAQVWDSKQSFSWSGEQLRRGIAVPISSDAEVIVLRHARKPVTVRNSGQESPRVQLNRGSAL